MVNDMNKEKGTFSMNVIGAGGIGSWIIHTLVRPARRFAQANDVNLLLRVYDSDKVDEANVHHQNFRISDVGKPKVDAVCEELAEFNQGKLALEPCEWDVRSDDDFEKADLTIVAVDSPFARDLVTKSAKSGKWSICSCAGDSYMFLTQDSPEHAISLVTNTSLEAASCQLPGAISEGKIESGNIAVAVMAQTWALRTLRAMSGDGNAKLPEPRAASTILGTLGSMSGTGEVAE